MEASNVVKLGGGVLGTGAVVGSAGYGVYEISNKENYKNLREKFAGEGKAILKTEGEEGYSTNVGGISDETIWQLLVNKYSSSENQNKRFKDLSNLTEQSKTKQKVLQEKCSSVLVTSLENETEAITWCTRSSSLLPDFSVGRPLAGPSAGPTSTYSFPTAPVG